MTYYSIYDKFDDSGDVARVAARRSDAIKKISSTTLDVLIVGGNLAAALTARFAVLQGLKVGLLCPDDFDTPLSGIDCIKAQFFDSSYIPFSISAIKSREELIQSAKHLCKDAAIGVAEIKQTFLEKLVSLASVGFDMLFSTRLNEAVYQSGRMVQEALVSARQEGAICINHADVVLCQHGIGNIVAVSWVDSLTGTKHETTASSVINSTGPNVAFMGRITPAEFYDKITFIKKTSLLFDSRWDRSPVSLQIPGLKGFCNVEARGDGTLVSYFAQATNAPKSKAAIAPDTREIKEILDYLAREGTTSSLRKKDLYFVSQELEAVPFHVLKGGMTPELLRFSWVYSNGTLSLVGGRYSTAPLVSQSGIQKLVEIGGNRIQIKPLGARPFPGSAGDYEREIVVFRDFAQRLHCPLPVALRTVARLGGRVRYFNDKEPWYRSIMGRILEGEVRIAIEQEDPGTLSDLMSSRLELFFEPDRGVPLLNEISTIYGEYYKERDIAAENAAYLAKVSQSAEFLASL